MVNFFHNGSQVGFSINGVGGAILLFYIIIELCMVFVSGVFLWRKLLIAFNVYRQIKSTIPRWWYISKISIITIDKKLGKYTVTNNNCNFLSWNYECYVHVSPKYFDGVWTNDYVKTNRWGKIKKCDLFDNIKTIDSKNQDKVKQYNRDSVLEEIGIN